MPTSSFPIYLVSLKLYVFLAAVAFSVVLLVTPLVRGVALGYGWVDLPCARKVHQQAVPRIGGLSIFLGTFLALAMFTALGIPNAASAESVDTLNSFYTILLGATGFFLVGLSDDLVSLSPFLRLVLQAAIASGVWLSGVRIALPHWSQYLLVSVYSGSAFDISGGISLLVTVFWLVGVVNAINWMDGLDGLAAGIAGIAAAISFVIFCSGGQLGSAAICVALLGSLAGFLIFNFNPAQIFMGDGGSYFVGFLLASVSITGFADGDSLALGILPLLILAVPLGDMTLVIVSRLRRGVSPFFADKSHIHHRLLRQGISHQLTVVLIYALASWIGSLALVLAGIPNSLTVVACATGLLLLVSYRALSSAGRRVSVLS